MIPSPLSGQEAASFTKIGITSVMDHDPASPLTYRGLPTRVVHNVIPPILGIELDTIDDDDFTRIFQVHVLEP